MKKLVAALCVLALLGGGGWYWYRGSQNGKRPQVRTARVARGSFLPAISATGTLQARDAIDVGAQVGARIVYFGVDPRREAMRQALVGADALAPFTGAAGFLLAGFLPTRPVDFGTPVEKGTVLAQLDDALFRTDVDLAKANLELARAAHQEITAKADQTRNEWKRSHALWLRRSISESELDLAKVNHEVAQANVRKGKADMDRAESSLKKAEILLDYTTIRSPVKGIVIDRKVNIGQTVVSSLNAPSLFLIATDLRKMQVWASVNEADIGQIQSGQEVRFTVDAYKGEVFMGRVAEDQPRLNATMVQNVVTYTVVVDTQNTELRLKPYQTANLKFILQNKESALLVPNAALRYRPRPDLVALESRGVLEKLKGRPAEGKDLALRVVWVQREEDGLLRHIEVQVGLSDGTMTEVLSGDLQEDTVIVTGEEARSDEDASNPFTPKMFGGGKKSGG